MIVRISFLQAGYCTHPAKVADTSANWRSLVFPASVAVIEHPQHGVVLYDTGYSERFYQETKRWPSRLYSWITPVFIDEGRTALAQLKKVGLSVRDVRTVVLSHFHGDHIGAVADFAHARFVYQAEAFNAVRDLRGYSALRKAFLPGLLPADFITRSEALRGSTFVHGPSELSAFNGAYDLFHDGTVWLVQMPGHTEGHVGMLVRTQSKDYLLAGDACYVRENFVHNRPSMAVTRLIFDDFAEYKRNLFGLHLTHREFPNLEVVPCHCEKTFAQLPSLGSVNLAPSL